jgi:hypothetical protein
MNGLTFFLTIWQALPLHPPQWLSLECEKYTVIHIVAAGLFLQVFYRAAAS